jgi:hypothetical protein
MSECGTDVGCIIRAINSGKVVTETHNYSYLGWTILHCAAFAGRSDVINHFLKHGVSLDVEAREYKEEYFKTPRTFLTVMFPEILKELDVVLEPVVGKRTL